MKHNLAINTLAASQQSSNSDRLHQIQLQSTAIENQSDLEPRGAEELHSIENEDNAEHLQLNYRVKWTKDATELFLGVMIREETHSRIRGANQNRLEMGRIWASTCQKFEQEPGFQNLPDEFKLSVNSNKLSSKFKSLKRTFRKWIDEIWRTTGRGAVLQAEREFAWFRIMREITKDDPSFNPSVIIQSASLQNEASITTSDGNGGAIRRILGRNRSNRADSRQDNEPSLRSSTATTSRASAPMPSFQEHVTSPPHSAQTANDSVLNTIIDLHQQMQQQLAASQEALLTRLLGSPEEQRQKRRREEEREEEEREERRADRQYRRLMDEELLASINRATDAFIFFIQQTGRPTSPSSDNTSGVQRQIN